MDPKLLKIDARFRNETIEGVSASVLKSALQKYIRRSMREKALWVASRLDLFCLVENGERVRTNFIHRLMIIFLEDVGIEGVRYWNEVDRLLFEICLTNRARAKRSTVGGLRDRGFEIRAIRRVIDIMVSIPKARSCSHLSSLFSEFGKRLKVNQKIVPTWIYDDSNKLGFAKFVFGLKDEEPFTILAKYYPNQNIISLGLRWYREIKTRERFLTWCIILVDLIFNPNYKTTQLSSRLTDLNVYADNWNDIPLNSPYITNIEPFVFDKHTDAKGANRSIEFFALEGAKVYPESIFVNEPLKNIYLGSKGLISVDVLEKYLETNPIISNIIQSADDMIIDGCDVIIEECVVALPIKDKVFSHDWITEDLTIDNNGEDLVIDKKVDDIIIDEMINDKPILDDEINELSILDEIIDENVIDEFTVENESQFGEFKFRIQLTTSNAKTDVYLVERALRPYIVKGPFLDVEILNRYLSYQVEKVAFGMPVTKNSIVFMFPDRWGEGVPLGLRNKTDRRRKYPFLISESLIPIEQYQLRTHSSKVWPPTVVIDQELTNLHLVSLNNLTLTLVIDYLNILGFRCKNKLSDIALRNLLIHNGRMYSIDEESIKSDFNLENELKKTNFTITKRLFLEFNNKMNPLIRSYLQPYL